MNNEEVIEKAKKGERINHWILALSFFILTLTGIGFLFHSLHWLNTLFGGGYFAKEIHRWAGVIFMSSLVLTMRSYLPEALSFSQEDREWLKLMGGYFSKMKLPPQGRLNAGQKLFFLTVLIFGTIISLSGFIISFFPVSRTWMQIGHFLHNLAFVVLVTLVPLHVYLATVLHPGTFRIMTRGTIPLKLAKERHSKWVQQMGFN